MFYLETICRFTLLFVFGLSFVSKLFDPRNFQHTIRRFDVVPEPLITPAAGLFMLLEATIVILLSLNYLMMAFGLSLLLLSVFSLALFSVIQRELQISCNCFGKSDERVTYAGLIRNGIYLLCAATGLFIRMAETPQALSLTPLTGLMMAVVAGSLAVFSLHIRSILFLFN